MSLTRAGGAVGRENQRRQKAPSQSTVVGHTSKGVWAPQGVADWELFGFRSANKD